MATRTWFGGSGDWSVPVDWIGASPGVPAAGDTVIIPSGVVTLAGARTVPDGKLDNVAVTLGTAAPATLQMQSAWISRFATLTIAGPTTLAATGTSGLAARIVDTAAPLTLSSSPGSTLVLLADGGLNLSGTASLTMLGQIAIEHAITTPASVAIQNAASVSILGNAVTFGGPVSGTGTLGIGFGGRLTLSGSVAAGQAVRFQDTNATLAISAPGTFAGSIAGFAPGDQIDIGGVTADAANVDPVSGTLSLTVGGIVVQTIANVTADPRPLVAAPDGAGGTLVSYAGSTTGSVTVALQAADRAMRSDVARTLLVPGTPTRITGAGVKVGIISVSFDVVDPGAAARDVAAGYLPANGVNVLREGASTQDDEGRAMAELVHQIAPGADIYFAAANGDLAGAVALLQQAGCQIIADDIIETATPVYQVAGKTALAVQSAVQAGVNYFASVGNTDGSYYD